MLERRRSAIGRPRCGHYLDDRDASVLQLVFTGWTQKGAWHGHSREIVERLIGMGLVEEHRSEFVPSADVRFSLRLDEQGY